MAKQKINFSSEVTEFLDELKHPFRKEIEQLRNYLLSANPVLTENIKWKAPNYSFADQDRITMRIQPPSKQVQLIFHRGASKQTQPKDKLISNKSSLLVWKENDRAIMTFKTMQDIENSKAELKAIVNEWISAASKTMR